MLWTFCFGFFLPSFVFIWTKQEVLTELKYPKMSGKTSTQANGTEVWQSAGQILSKFDKNKDNAIDLVEFKALCFDLFGSDECKQYPEKISEIFKTLDFDADGLLKDDEWNSCFNDWIKVVLHPVNVFAIIDVQNDFISGTLALKDLGLGQDGADVVKPINNLIKECSWKKVIYSLDWHPPNHISFYENLNLRKLHPNSKVKKENAKLFDTVLFLEPKIEQKLWPAHCVIRSWGAELHKNLIVAPDSIQIRKGQDPEVDSYSAFFDNNSSKSTELPQVLEELGATDLYVCGLAYDVCVFSTCMDGLKLGYRVALIENCSRGVDPEVGIPDAKRKIYENGGLTLTTDEVKDYVDGGKKSLIMALKRAHTVAQKKKKN